MPFGVDRFLRRQAAWLTLVAGLTASAALGWQLHREAIAMDRQRLAMRVAEVTSQLDARIEKSEMLLQNLRDYLMFSGESRAQVFDRWCYDHGLSINCPWLHGVAVATNRYQAQWRDQLPKPADTWTRDDWETFHELTRTQVNDFSIAMTSEVKDKKRFLARYDLQRLLRDKDQFALVLQTSRVSMSEPRPVMLDANSNLITSTFFCVPVHKAGVADFLAVEGFTRTKGQEALWLHLTSVILAPVDFKVLAESVWDASPSDLGMELFSSTNQATETWLNISEGIPRAADPKFKTYLTHRQLWPMYGMKFSIFYYTTPLFEAQSPRRLAKIALAAGTALTFLASALVAVASRARNRQEQMTEQIREARDALAAAQQARNKFSRDLHDGTIQSLYAIQLGLDHLVEKLDAEPAKARRELSAMRTELDAVIAEIRRFITTEAATGKSVEFAAVLQALVQRARTGTTAQITLHCDPAASRQLTGDQAVQLANIAREALSNSLRHAKPQRVEIALRVNCDALILEIADDGAGFDPTSTRKSGVGLASMTARTREMNGTLEIQSSPGKGTRLVVRVPATNPEALENSRTDRVTDEL
jgi:signal transduction histidine kinase